jgi:hypothetical protein
MGLSQDNDVRDLDTQVNSTRVVCMFAGNSGSSQIKGHTGSCSCSVKYIGECPHTAVKAKSEEGFESAKTRAASVLGYAHSLRTCNTSTHKI